jgi:hypothetical protein
MFGMLTVVIIELRKVPLRTDSTNLASQDGTFSTPVRPYPPWQSNL